MDCVHCGIAISQCTASSSRPLDKDPYILTIVRAWVAPRTVNPNHHLCQACWDLAIDMFLVHESPEDIPAFGSHIHVCIHCGFSLLKAQSHSLHSNLEREQRIRAVISEWILPRTVGALSAICHSCWVKADRAACRVATQPLTSAPVSGMHTPAIASYNSLISNEESPTSEMPISDLSPPSEETNEPAHRTIPDTIFLPDYLRPIQTERKCFVGGCKQKERNRIPTSLRINLLNMHNYYVHYNNRICNYHLNNAVERLELLVVPTHQYSINTFTASHIQDMLALKSHTIVYNTLMPTTSSASNS